MYAVVNKVDNEGIPGSSKSSEAIGRSCEVTLITWITVTLPAWKDCTNCLHRFHTLIVISCWEIY